MSKNKIIQTIISLSILSVSINVNAQQDPISTYIFEGKSVAPWKLSVGNALNYNIPVNKQKAKTKRKNLIVSPGTKNNDGDAINVKWKGKVVKNQWGGNALNDSFLSISKNNIDISSVKDQAALVIEMKINKSPNLATSLALQCKYDNNNCSSQYPIKHILKNMPQDEWITLPIPLACFSKTTKDGDFDFSKITAFTIATQGKLDIDIATIGLAALPPGKTGCN
ncbi:MAG: putative glycoside hydrolase [Thalassotalea sp.]